MTAEYERIRAQREVSTCICCMHTRRVEMADGFCKIVGTPSAGVKLADKHWVLGRLSSLVSAIPRLILCGMRTP